MLGNEIMKKIELIITKAKEKEPNFRIYFDNIRYDDEKDRFEIELIYYHQNGSFATYETFDLDTEDYKKLDKWTRS